MAQQNYKRETSSLLLFLVTLELTSAFSSRIRGTIVDWVEGCKRIAAVPHTSSHHVIHPIEAIINGDRAICYSTADMTVRATIDDVEVDMSSFVRFTNRLVRTVVESAGDSRKEWRIVSFQTTYVSDNIQKTGSGATVAGGGGGEGGKQQLGVRVEDGARSSYKYLEWVLRQRGIQVTRDLPGTDIPESAAKVVEEAEAWLWESDKE